MKNQTVVKGGFGRLRAGQCFGVNAGDLYCEVKSGDGSVVNAHVINGCWDFTMDRSGFMTYTTPIGVQTMQCEKLYVDKKLQSFGYDYNAACAYLRVQDGRNGAVVALVNAVDDVTSAIRGFYLRLKAACGAFGQSWSGKNHGVCDECDEIPF